MLRVAAVLSVVAALVTVHLLLVVLVFFAMVVVGFLLLVVGFAKKLTISFLTWQEQVAKTLHTNNLPRIRKNQRHLWCNQVPHAKRNLKQIVLATIYLQHAAIGKKERVLTCRGAQTWSTFEVISVLAAATGKRNQNVFGAWKSETC